MSFTGILIVIVCAVLVLIVLVQNSKGGGLASNFASNNQILGVAKTKDILEQITWGAAGLLLLLCLLSAPKKQAASPATDANGQTTQTSGKASKTRVKANAVAAGQQSPLAPGSGGAAPKK